MEKENDSNLQIPQNSVRKIIAGCRTTAMVEFAIPNVDLLQICPDRANGTITIQYNGVCKQTLKLNDIRMWSVYQKDGQMWFRDEPSDLLALGYGFPTISAPFTGSFNHHLKFKGVSDDSCAFILIGTDDYRDLGYATVHFNIHNATSARANYIDIQIYTYNASGSTRYGAYIKHSKYEAATMPSLCGDVVCDSFVCLTAAINFPACP